jgi:hypothetical protein
MLEVVLQRQCAGAFQQLGDLVDVQKKRTLGLFVWVTAVFCFFPISNFAGNRLAAAVLPYPPQTALRAQP